MVRIVDLLLGKYDISVEAEDLGEITTFLLKMGISARISAEGIITVSGRGYREINSEYGEKIKLISRRFGVFSLLCCLKKRIPSLICMFFCTVLFLFSSLLVWDVRVSGNETLTEKQITEMLKTSGLSVGNSFRKMDMGMIETAMLDRYNEISWININRRGTVAYVEILESKSLENNTENTECVGNIVAEIDCVIEEVVVKKGVANVKAGDIVRQGDVLISGIVESEQGTVLCRAEGIVTGRCIYKVVGESKRTENINVGIEKSLCCFDVNFFDFKINILKNSRNLCTTCDIILEEQGFVTPFGKKMPFGFTKKYEIAPLIEYVTYSDDEMIRLAFKRHARRIDEMSESFELVCIKTSSGFTNDGYKVESTVTCSLNVGVFSEITVG